MDIMINVLKCVIIFVYGGVVGCISNMLVDYFVKKVSSENGGQKVIFNAKYLSYSCGCRRKGIEALPIIGCVLNKGICNKCNKKINKRYLVVELLMGVLFVIVMLVNKSFLTSFLFCLVVAALVILSIVDLNTFEIPIELNYFICAIGIIMTIIDYKNIFSHVVGAIIISGLIYILIVVTHGRAMGGGDCKLMFTCGLLLGWKLIIVAFIFGCILGSIIHIARIKISGEEKMLAFGPYLAAGVYIAYVWGDSILKLYMSMY